MSLLPMASARAEESLVNEAVPRPIPRGDPAEPADRNFGMSDLVAQRLNERHMNRGGGE